MTEPFQPLAGIRVLEFGHTILGPAAGMVLADLGAEVVKIEPPGGERTRRLKGFGAGYFGAFNRNKTSVFLDYKTPEGLAAAEDLVRGADVLIENMGPGALARAGFSAEDCARLNPRLIYCSLKGFLPGPFEQRTALDEVVQMMSGLAYMTGPPGRPLRAGTSITDILGGVFGALGVVVALFDRLRTGRGLKVDAALYETAAFLMAQHMAQSAQTGTPLPPMPARVSAWAVYDVFATADDPVFLGITSDAHWLAFCRAFDTPDLAADPDLSTNNQRIDRRGDLIPAVAAVLAALPAAEVERRAVGARLPFGRIARPEDLFDDPHLNGNGSLAETRLPDGPVTRLPLLPLRFDGRSLEKRLDPPGLDDEPH